MSVTTNSTTVWAIGHTVAFNVPTQWRSRGRGQMGTRAWGRINTLNSAI